MGLQSVRKKQDRVRQLLVSSRESEAQFIVRLLQGKIRINMGPKTVVVRITTLIHELFSLNDV
jgi:ATP-dependent DNA ligase